VEDFIPTEENINDMRAKSAMRVGPAMKKAEEEYLGQFRS